jgi:50S ribosomal protein L16 3-hydroxylase
VYVRPGLKKLLHPFSDADFIEHHWPNKPLVLHHGIEALAELTQLPALQSPASIFGACSGTSVTAMMPDKKDESNSVQVTPDVAAKLFAAGMNVSVGSAEKFFPMLKDWADNLIKDLGLPRTTWGRSIVYASPPDTGAPAHFDMNANFSLQIKGKKTWTIAPNANVTYPTERHVMHLEPSATLLAQSDDGAFPKEMPSDARPIELSPGSLLFIPRGWWHATSSTEETIALNFTFSQQSWAVLFALTLVERLHQHEQWRKTPFFGRARTSADLASQRDEVQALLDDVRGHMVGMLPPELLDIVSIYTHGYRRREGVVLHRDGDAIALDIKGKGRMPIDTPVEYRPIFELVFGEGRPSAWFRMADVIEHNTGKVQPTDIFILLQRLVEAEVLESKDEG